MVKFVQNVNDYLAQMKIKQTYVSMKTGINPSTLSRILNGSRKINASEMELIAKAVGKPIEFFLDGNGIRGISSNMAASKVFCYAGEPTKEQEKITLDLVALLENIDEVLGAKSRYMMGE